MPKLLKLSKTPKVKNVEDAINIKLKTVDRAGSKLRMKFLSQLGAIIFLLKFLFQAASIRENLFPNSLFYSEFLRNIY